MLRKLIAAGAIAGMLVAGSAGIAGAASNNTATAPSAPKACAKAPAVIARLEKANTKYQAWLPKAEANEQKAKATHKTLQADRIAARIARAQAVYQRGLNLSHKIESHCPGVTTSGSGSSTSSGTTNASTATTG
jgi:hypothetical protein